MNSRNTGLCVIQIAALAMTIAFFGCANLQTVQRTTKIPSSYREGDDAQRGVAIHLDAQQRLVLSTIKGFCAEPSPDALSAYAASLGLGVTTSNRDAASVAQALQSSTGSIGLRTQSITLMRDALYRMCEASHNSNLGTWEITGLLRRSQDLTAVVLAIEQLTGAVTAHQISLTPDARASAAANLVPIQQLLDHFDGRVENARQELKLSQKNLQDVSGKALEADSCKTANDSGESGDIVTTEAVNGEGEDTIPDVDDGIRNAQEQCDTALHKWDEARRERDEIKGARDAVFTNLTEDVNGTAASARPIQAKPLSDSAANSIAIAVTNMVKTVLSKDYTRDTCVSFMTAFDRNLDQSEIGLASFGADYCQRYLEYDLSRRKKQESESEQGLDTEPEPEPEPPVPGRILGAPANG